MSLEDKERPQQPFLKTTLTSTFQTKNDLCQQILERNFIRSSCLDYDGLKTILDCDDFKGSMKSERESKDYSMKQIEVEKEGRGYHLERGHQFGQLGYGNVSKNHDVKYEEINESRSRSSGEHEVIEEIISAYQNISLNEMPSLEGEKEERKESTLPIDGKNIDLSERNDNDNRCGSSTVIGSHLNLSESELFEELKVDQGGLSANGNLKPFDLESGEQLWQNDHESISNFHRVIDEEINESYPISSVEHEVVEQIFSADQNIFLNEMPPLNVDTVEEDSEYEGSLVPDKATSTFRVASVGSEKVYSEDVDFTQSNKDHEFNPLEDFNDQDLDSLGDSISITFDPVNEVEEVIFDQRYPSERANPFLNHCKSEPPDSDENEVDLITRENIEEKLGDEKDFEEERGVEISECTDEETLSNMVLNTFSMNPSEQNHRNQNENLEKCFIDEKFLDKGPINPGQEEKKNDNNDSEEVLKLKAFLSKEETDLRNLTNYSDNSLHENSFSPFEKNERQLDYMDNEDDLQEVSEEEITEELFNESQSRSPTERQDVGEIISVDKNTFNNETIPFNLGQYDIVDQKVMTLDPVEMDSEYGNTCIPENPYKNQREIKTDYNCNNSKDNTENEGSEKVSSSGEYDLEEPNFDQQFTSEKTNSSLNEDFQKKNEGKEWPLNLRGGNERWYHETIISEESNDNEDSPLSDPFSPEEVDKIAQKRIFENEKEVSQHLDLSRESNDEEVVFEQINVPSFLEKVAPDYKSDEGLVVVVAENGLKGYDDQEDHILATWKNKESQIVPIDEAQDMQETDKGKLNIANNSTPKCIADSVRFAGEDFDLTKDNNSLIGTSAEACEIGDVEEMLCDRRNDSNNANQSIDHYKSDPMDQNNLQSDLRNEKKNINENRYMEREREASPIFNSIFNYPEHNQMNKEGLDCGKYTREVFTDDGDQTTVDSSKDQIHVHTDEQEQMSNRKCRRKEFNSEIISPRGEENLQNLEYNFENSFPEKISSREMTQIPIELKKVKEVHSENEKEKETIGKKGDNSVGNNNWIMEDILMERREPCSDYREGPWKLDSAIDGKMKIFPTVSGGVIQTSSKAFKRDHSKSSDKKHEEGNGKSNHKELKSAKASNIYDRYKIKVDLKTQEPYQTSNSQDDPIRFGNGGKDPRFTDSQYAFRSESLKEFENIIKEPLQRLNNISSVNDHFYKCNSFEYRSQRQPQNLGPIPGIFNSTYGREKYLQEVAYIPCPSSILTSGLSWQTPSSQFSRGSSFENGIVINSSDNKSEDKFPLCQNCYKHHSPINDNVSSFQGVTFPEASSVTNLRRPLSYDPIMPERKAEKPILKEAYLNTNISSHNFDVRPKYRPLFSKSATNTYSKVRRDRIKNDTILDQYNQSRVECADDIDNTSLRMRVYCRGKLIHDPEDSR